MRRTVWILPVLAVLAGCGSEPRPSPPPADPPPAARDERAPPEPPSAERPPSEPTAAEVETIRGWSDALRAGHVAEAAGYFALPALVSNPAPVLRLRDRAAVESFNEALPCGAKLVGTERGSGSLVVATFRLTERPGPGRCGAGTGQHARTAFLIRDGRIEHWLRVADPPEPDAQPS